MDAPSSSVGAEVAGAGGDSGLADRVDGGRGTGHRGLQNGFVF